LNSFFKTAFDFIRFSFSVRLEEFVEVVPVDAFGFVSGDSFVIFTFLKSFGQDTTLRFPDLFNEIRKSVLSQAINLPGRVRGHCFYSAIALEQAMYRVDNRGRPYDVRRSLNTRVSGELLVGSGWEAIAHAELKRLALEIGIYHQQLKSFAGYEETGAAVKALEQACDAIEAATEAEEA
jgi:hypothetical protein